MDKTINTNQNGSDQFLHGYIPLSNSHPQTLKNGKKLDEIIRVFHEYLNDTCAIPTVVLDSPKATESIRAILERGLILISPTGAVDMLSETVSLTLFDVKPQHLPQLTHQNVQDLISMSPYVSICFASQGPLVTAYGDQNASELVFDSGDAEEAFLRAVKFFEEDGKLADVLEKIYFLCYQKHL